MSDDQGAALTALKTLLGAMVPGGGEPSPVGVYVYPDEYSTLNLDALPVILISEAVGLPSAMARQAQTRAMVHKWQAQIMILLAEGTLTDDRSAAEVAARHRPWVNVLAKTLVANGTLSGTVYGVGIQIPGDLYTYRIGHIPWWATRNFWGVVATVDIYQKVSGLAGP